MVRPYHETILVDNEDSMQRGVNELQQKTIMYGLEISVCKTKSMAFKGAFLSGLN